MPTRLKVNIYRKIEISKLLEKEENLNRSQGSNHHHS